MFLETLSFLKCPCCGGELSLEDQDSVQGDILRGSVVCNGEGCGAVFPILAGVLVLVPDVRRFLIEHVKGISRLVSDSEIPKRFLGVFAKAKRALASEHIEEDLESERVTSLYLMTSYLRAGDFKSSSRAIDEIVEKHWDSGPVARIAARVSKMEEKLDLVELGCGVGGLFAALRGNLRSYLGLDSSFASVALARHLAFGAPYRGALLRPDDLLNGPVSKEMKISVRREGHGGELDFIVCDVNAPPVKGGRWTAAAALNLIDMLPEPKWLPMLQHSLLLPGGLAIQSSPYIWHQDVARSLREDLPRATSSAEAVELLYAGAGFSVLHVENDVPWVFFKNARQAEIYSVHLFFAARSGM